MSSFLGSALLVGVSVATAKAIPHGTRVPYAEAFGSLVAFVPPTIALFALLFVVAGYELDAGELRIRRLLWSTRVPLSGMRRIYADSHLMNRSLKVFGNGGLFSFTGLYQNRALGRYRAFVTDPRRCVALFLPDRVVVVSPMDTTHFIHSVRSQFPGIEVGPPSAAHE